MKDAPCLSGFTACKSADSPTGGRAGRFAAAVRNGPATGLLRGRLNSHAMRVARTAAASALVTLLGACASMIPDYQRPAAPVAPSFPYDSGAAAAKSAPDIAWADFFQDARLKQLIATALDNNRDLRAAILAIEQARATLRIRRADELPTVSLGAAGSRMPSGNGGSTTVYQAGATITGYEIDFFGRVKSLGEAALAQLLGTEEARKTVQITLVASVAQTYLSLVADDLLLRVTQETLKTREESLRLTKLKFDNGVSSELEMRQAESLLAGARVSLAQTNRQRALDINALNLLVGQPMTESELAALPVGLSLTAQGLLTELPAGVPSELLARRPDVRQAEQQLIAANANIGAARAAFFPRISLTAGFGSASSELDKLFHGGTWGLTLAPQLLWPLFDAGRNQANLDSAQVGRQIAVAQYERAIQTAFREIADALATRATLVDQLQAQTAQTRAAEAALRLVELRYRNGVASYFEMLDAQRTVFGAQLATVQTQLVQQQNLVHVYKVLGGGWTQPTARAAP